MKPLKAFALLFVLCVIAQAHAWNKAGHYVTAAIAYESLNASDPKALERAIAVLEAHPAYSEWQSDLKDNPEVDAKKALFMLAAAFADEARRGQFKSYDKPDWHYVNFPITPGQPLVDVRRTAPMAGRLIEAINNNAQKYRDAKANSEERAVALSWLLHLVSDLHQPLHVATLVTKDLPDGDKGGNKVFVRASEKAQTPMPLHAIWDGAIAGNLDLQRAANRATALLAESQGTPEGIDANTWVTESYKLAASSAYLDGKLKFALSVSDEVPALPDGYTKEMQEVARARAVLAGKRIAALLK